MQGNIFPTQKHWIHEKFSLTTLKTFIEILSMFLFTKKPKVPKYTTIFFCFCSKITNRVFYLSLHFWKRLQVRFTIVLIFLWKLEMDISQVLYCSWNWNCKEKRNWENLKKAPFAKTKQKSRLFRKLRGWKMSSFLKYANYMKLQITFYRKETILIQKTWIFANCSRKSFVLWNNIKNGDLA